MPATNPVSVRTSCAAKRQKSPANKTAKGTARNNSLALERRPGRIDDERAEPEKNEQRLRPPGIGAASFRQMSGEARWCRLTSLERSWRSPDQLTSAAPRWQENLSRFFGIGFCGRKRGDDLLKTGVASERIPKRMQAQLSVANVARNLRRLSSTAPTRDRFLRSRRR